MQFLKNYFLVLFVSIIALAFPIWELHTDFNEKEQFILREIEGVKILSALSLLAKSIPEHRGYTKSNMLAGRYAVELDITKLRLSNEIENVIQAYADAKIDVSLERLLMLRTDLEALIELPIHHGSESGLWEEANETFLVHNEVMDDLELMIREIADKSNLILDPSLETYYLMDLVVNRFPLIINEIGKTRGMLVGLEDKRQPSMGDYLYLENLYTHTKFLLSTLSRSLSQASLHADIGYESLTGYLDKYVERYGRYFKAYAKRI